MGQGNLVIPPPESIDCDKVDFVVAVDLDELTVLFYGPDREAYVHPVGEVLSYLIDVETEEVVGVRFSQFSRQVLGQVPEMRDVIFDASFIMNDFVGSLEDLVGHDPTWGVRIGDIFEAARHAWDSHEDRGHLRDVMKGIQAFG